MAAQTDYRRPIYLWLDDIRLPPDGWTWVKTVDEAIEILISGRVEMASLDHDLGACNKCNGSTAEAWLEGHDYKSMPHCEHYGTGYTLICWMEENNVWPNQKPIVHSANPVGRQRMQMVIDKVFS